MAQLDSTQLEMPVREIVRRLATALSPVLVILFGSYAYGQPTRDSDLDFLVVVDESSLSAYERDAIAYGALGGIRIPVDVQVYTRKEFEERASLPVFFERTVRQKGRIVYAA